MCDAWESHEFYRVCELVRQLGALYEKEKKKGAADDGIKWERRHVSARLIQVTKKMESERFSAPPCNAIRES